MRDRRKAAFIAAAVAVLAAMPAPAQEGAPRLDGVMGEDGVLVPISANVRVFPVTDNAESCAYDAASGFILALNRGEAPKDAPDDGTISLIGHDGMIDTQGWTGEAAELVLNQPYGSAIAGGALYVLDRKGGTSKKDPPRAVLKVFNVATGALRREVEVDSPGLNDLAVAGDGMVYATQTSAGGGKREKPDPESWKVFAIPPEGDVSVLIEGEPLNQPNGIEMDNEGNIVVVNLGDTGVLTFSREGKLLGTEEAAQPGSDGLVILGDGTKYVNSLRQGGVSRIAPGAAPELIATGIPGAASMCYDAGANQLVIPMGENGALAFVPLP